MRERAPVFNEAGPLNVVPPCPTCASSDMGIGRAGESGDSGGLRLIGPVFLEAVLEESPSYSFLRVFREAPYLTNQPLGDAGPVGCGWPLFSHCPPSRTPRQDSAWTDKSCAC